jgi:hypothetical protein
MGTQYVCKNEQRRRQVRDSGTALNGVDYLEVRDQGLPDDQRQRLIELRFLKPDAIDTLSADNFRIDGGVRITGIRLIADPIIDGTDPQLLHLELSGWGDYSTYRLRLIDPSAPDDPPAGFDRALAEVGFSFKIDCPSDFDCPRPPACEPAIAAPPALDYLAKDYASFRRLMLDRLAVTLPQWTERNAADVGVALVETLAYSADHLSYYQDAVATEAYLGTARQRVSLRRHARLLDYRMHQGCNARCWISIEVSHDILPAAPSDFVLPGGTRLLTRVTPEPVVDPADLAEAMIRSSLVFETMQPMDRLLEKRNRILFHTWSDDRCCLPKGATRATLLGSRAELALQRGDVLVFEELLGPDSGLSADADPNHRHAVRLVGDPRELTDQLTGEQVLELEWHAEDALPFPLCLWELADAEGHRLPVSVARANIVLADHGRRIDHELEVSAGSDPDQHRGITPSVVPVGAHYRPRLLAEDITHSAALRQPASATASLEQNPGEAEPVVSLFDGVEKWAPQRDLLASGRFDNRFVIEAEDDGRAWLRFGDGIHGKRPIGGTAFAASVRIGNGTAGNVGAGAIAHLVADLDGVIRVTNPLPACGGIAAEPLEQVRLHAPQAFRTQRRAVTEADYARMTERFPGVQRAQATRRWTGSWYTMFITVDRLGGLPVSAEFEANLRRHLEQYRLAGHDLEIDAPRYVALDIAFTVCVKPGYLPGDVEQALLKRFGTRDLDHGRRGFFHPDNFSFGDPLYLSRMIAAAMEVPGVAWVDAEPAEEKPGHRFLRLGEQGADHYTSGRIEMQRLEVLRLDNDPNAPENGRIEFLMEGGV